MSSLFFNGRAQPYAGLECWDNEVRATGKYPYYPKKFEHSRKEFGQMKYYLMELMNYNGLSEEEIRNDIHEFVRRWDYVKSADRTLFIPMQSGLLWEKRMPHYPDFSFFFMARRVLVGVLMTAKVPDPEEKTRHLPLPKWW